MPPASPAIHCHQLSKRFGDSLALDRFELEVPVGSVLALLGPSGCGKTTALRIIAGFDRPDAGSVEIAGRRVVGDGVNIAPEKRRVGMVFQDYALFPHMTVEANVGYGVDGNRTGQTSRALGLVGLQSMAQRMPHELSGGEQQRVALARALAPEPAVILLDEPFSNLDATLRDRMRRDVRGILNEAETTAVFVTHDQEEALAIADIVAVMREGRVEQVGTPEQVYTRPNNPWIAGFVGESEFIDGVADVGRVTTPVGVFPHFSEHRGPVQVMIRPEWIHPTVAVAGIARIVDREFYGHDQMLILELADGSRISARTGANSAAGVGDRVDIGIDEIVVFPA